MNPHSGETDHLAPDRVPSASISVEAGSGAAPIRSAAPGSPGRTRGRPWASWDPGQSADCTVKGPVRWVSRKNFLSPYAMLLGWWTVAAPGESSAASAAVRG